MAVEFLVKRALSTLLLATLVFAPSPSSWRVTPVSPGAKAETLAAQILSPTFDEGVIREGVRSAFSAVGKRRDLPTSWAAPPSLSLSVLVLLAAVILLKQNPKTHFVGFAPLGSRAPPKSV